MSDRPRVVILGGGFGGLGAARELKHADADIVLIDQHNYHTFQPMLYQVATDLLAPDVVAHPLRDVLHDQDNLTIHRSRISGIDLAGRQVQFEDMPPLSYDYLVLALGARVNFFGVTGAQEHAFPLYTLPDAVRLKDHILHCWEAADKDASLIEDGALNVVVVGGGPTGVESAGAIAELYHSNFVKDFPHLPVKSARVLLVEFAPALLGMFKPDIQTYTRKALEKRGVEVCTGDGVVEVSPTRVQLKAGGEIRAHTLVWGAGMQANPLVTQLAGVELQKGGRVPVGPDLSLPDHPEVFVVGDIAWITDSKTKQVLPQLGSVALQSGEDAAKNIARRLTGNPTEAFTYVDKGSMATIGRGAAVAQLPTGTTMKGKMAWLAWGTVHLALLTGGDSRSKTMVEWGWSGLTRKRTHRVSIDVTEE